MKDKPVLARIRIFPFKGLDPQEVTSATVVRHGSLKHDREFALFDAEGRVVSGKRERTQDLRVQLFRRESGGGFLLRNTGLQGFPAQIPRRRLPRRQKSPRTYGGEQGNPRGDSGLVHPRGGERQEALSDKSGNRERPPLLGGQTRQKRGGCGFQNRRGSPHRGGNIQTLSCAHEGSGLGGGTPRFCEGLCKNEGGKPPRVVTQRCRG